MSEPVVHAYRYHGSSLWEPGHLRLAASDGPAAPGPYLRATARDPVLLAQTLRLVSDVVRSRHHIPAAMLERILLEADPIFTFGGDQLRVEGFSSCAGVYVRADIGAAQLEVAEARPGTTNVDFNADMRAALARVRGGDALELEVGAQGVAMRRTAPFGAPPEQVVERKVALPLRWLRGLAEVQAVLSRMVLRFELDHVGAARLLRSVPRSGRTSDAAWLVPRGATLQLSATPSDAGLRVAGPARLRALEAPAVRCRSLRVFEDPRTHASAWRLDLGGTALTVALSPDTWRGFSGEGQLLSQLAAGEPATARIRSTLAWQSVLRVQDVADGDDDAARRGLAWLATRGLVGFDLDTAAWFHRVLPFDLDEVAAKLDAHQPRLASARKLVAEGAVTIDRRGDPVQARVSGDDVTHRVAFDGPEQRCTCPWYAKHQGERGPCKHVLAVEIALAGDP